MAQKSDPARVSPAPLLAAVEDFIESRGGGQGHFSTTMDGVHIMRAFQEVMPIRRMYKPSLCVVLNGAKEILFGDTTLHYGVMECLIVSLELPAKGWMVGATHEDPFTGINIEIDVSVLREVLQQLPAPQRPGPLSDSCAFVGQVDAPLADCMMRFVRLAQAPDAAAMLYPSAMRELCYWLLTGPYGHKIAKLALPETHTERIARAICLLRENFNRTLRVEELAEAARMSASSFHHHFKAMTSMTPVQYQKQLRLLEARRLMVSEAANVSEAAYQVGYESASQFSREYSRAFGSAPKRDVMNYKALMAVGQR
ncbi:AraC family transcriptional regulator [Sphingomonas sp.]|uniref:AraC family transcriptional regulator n=1 Tax=Sphingomonas sp. TaxID=28214 RepID=UPI002BB36B48|nr:AraC family transcriptional regulator [Sphingomonas sp.]HTG37660.1 AraC family transcriptional regulator [Sphingomonas sp.]